MMKDKNKKKNKVIKGIALLGLFLMVFGISYALFRVTLNGNKTNRIRTGKFSLMITDLNDNPQYTLDDTYKNDLTEAINIDNALPISDEEGKEQEEKYEFKLVNIGGVNASYELLLEDLDIELDEERLSSSLVKYSLIKDGVEKIGTLDNRVIDSDLIGKGEEIIYTLRIWIKEEAIREEAEDKVFNAHLKLNGKQYNGEMKKVLWTKDISENQDGSVIASMYSNREMIIEGTGRTMNSIYDLSYGCFVEFVYRESNEYLNYCKTKKELNNENVNSMSSEEILSGCESTKYDNAETYLMFNYYFASKGATSFTYEEFINWDDDDWDNYLKENSFPALDVLSLSEEFVQELLESDAKKTGKINYFPKKIIISEGITSIGKFLFAQEDYLEQIELPNTLIEINDSAFWESYDIKSITIPHSVSFVGDRAFGSWVDDQTINIDNTSLYVNSNWHNSWNNSSAQINYLRD